MRICFVLAVAFLLALIPNTVLAQQHDGNELLQGCNAAITAVDHSEVAKPSEGLGVGLCIGMVRGVIESMLVWQIADNARKRGSF